MRIATNVLLAPFLFTGLLFPSTGTPDASTVSGKWALQNNGSEELVIEQNGDTIQVRETRAGATTSEFTCNILGKECKAKEGGHSAKVSVWFNGPKLVEILTRGSDVTRKRYTVTENGTGLQVEVSSMSSNGKTETLVYTRR
jgi:hypothetical protein